MLSKASTWCGRLIGSWIWWRAFLWVNRCSLFDVMPNLTDTGVPHWDFFCPCIVPEMISVLEWVVVHREYSWSPLDESDLLYPSRPAGETLDVTCSFCRSGRVSLRTKQSLSLAFISCCLYAVVEKSVYGRLSTDTARLKKERPDKAGT